MWIIKTLWLEQDITCLKHFKEEQTGTLYYVFFQQDSRLERKMIILHEEMTHTCTICLSYFSLKSIHKFRRESTFLHWLTRLRLGLSLSPVTFLMISPANENIGIRLFDLYYCISNFVPVQLIQRRRCVVVVDVEVVGWRVCVEGPTS